MQPVLETLFRPLLPDHLLDCRPDPDSPQRRRFTASYQRKVALVKHLWIGAGLVVWLDPTIAMLLIVGLPMIFLALTLLDETP